MGNGAVREVSTVDTAKELRRTLRAAWPGVAFWVRSHGDAYHTRATITWIDGPTEETVRATVKAHLGDDDGPTRTRRVDEHGGIVRYGIGYTSAHRSVTRELVERAMAEQQANGRAVNVTARYWSPDEAHGHEVLLCFDDPPANGPHWLYRVIARTLGREVRGAR